jgi:glycosyltransferase involved in cell wall biosynthesis
MLASRRVVVVMPAYNAALTLRRTVGEIDRSIVDEILMVDDASTDATIQEARRLGITIELHHENRGYGGAQKTCYSRALAHNADVIVMLHPDYQYSPRLVPAMAAMIAYGEYDFVLGSRILAQDAVAGGMPLYKYAANRALTLVENLMIGSKLSEFHTGLRAYSRELLEAIPYERNSEDFVFDNQVIVQALAAGARVGELSCPTRYEPESSSINFWRSVKYGFGVLQTASQYRRLQSGKRSAPYLRVDPMHTPSEPKALGSVGQAGHATHVGQAGHAAHAGQAGHAGQGHVSQAGHAGDVGTSEPSPLNSSFRLHPSQDSGTDSPGRK